MAVSKQFRDNLPHFRHALQFLASGLLPADISVVIDLRRGIDCQEELDEITGVIRSVPNIEFELKHDEPNELHIWNARHGNPQRRRQ